MERKHWTQAEIDESLRRSRKWARSQKGYYAQQFAGLIFFVLGAIAVLIFFGLIARVGSGFGGAGG